MSLAKHYIFEVCLQCFLATVPAAALLNGNYHAHVAYWNYDNLLDIPIVTWQ